VECIPEAQNWMRMHQFDCIYRFLQNAQLEIQPFKNEWKYMAYTAVQI